MSVSLNNETKFKKYYIYNNFYTNVIAITKLFIGVKIYNCSISDIDVTTLYKLHMQWTVKCKIN